MAGQNAYLKQPLPPGNKAIGLALSAGGQGSILATCIGDPKVLSSMLNAPFLRSAWPGALGTVGGVATESVVLVSKDARAPSTATLVLGKQDHLLRSFTIVEKTKNGTSTLRDACSNIQVNPDLPDSAFIFIPPKGARRIYPPRSPAAPKR